MQVVAVCVYWFFSHVKRDTLSDLVVEFGLASRAIAYRQHS